MSTSKRGGASVCKQVVPLFPKKEPMCEASDVDPGF
jgi:hypothetical protein